MPIRPENKARYPKNWQQIRERILKRGGNNCEFCGVPNHEYIIRPDNSDGWELARKYHPADSVYIVLTIAHLDHQPEHNSAKNLKALCQRCHLRYDAQHHAESRYKNQREGKALKDMFA